MWRPCLCTLAWQPEAEGWWFSWPAGPAGHCCRAAGHMLVVPSDPGRPSGLGCVATGGSKCPCDPSQQPVEREAWIKSHTRLGPAFLLHFCRSLGNGNAGCWSRFPYLLPNLTGSHMEGWSTLVPLWWLACVLCSVTLFFVKAAHWRQVQNLGSLSIFFKHPDHL